MKAILLSTLLIGMLGIASTSTSANSIDTLNQVARVNETPDHHDAQEHA